MKTFNALSEEVTQKQLNDVEKFADRILAKFNVDIEFTRHFADRMNDDRNKPAVSVAELQQIFKKIARKKAKDIRQNPDSEAVIKDIQKDLNLPVVIRYNRNKEEFEVTTKTIMRKKDFKTTSKVITTEAKKMKDDPCWKDHEMVGTKKKNGKEVPNCVPKEDVSLESTKEYGKSQAAIARKRQQAAMRPGEMDKLKRLKDMLKNANNKVGVVKKESVDEATIEEATMGPDKLEMLRKAYGSVNKIDPSSPTYKKMEKMIDGMSQDHLKGLAFAKIKFLSMLAATKLRYKHNVKLDFGDYWAESVDHDLEQIEEAVQDWTVTVTKPVNKLKKGATQKVKARSAFEAINKAVKLWGDPALKAAPMNSFSITKESVELDEAAGKYSKSGDNLMYKWGDVNKALMNAGLNPRVILNVLTGLSKKEVKESVELDEGYQNKVLASKGQWVFQNKGEIQQIKYKGKVIGDGYYDQGSDSFDVSWTDFKRGQKNNRKGGTMFDTAQDVVDFFSKMKITESVDLEEGKMKEFHAMVKKGMTAAQIAKKIGMKEKDVAEFMKGMNEAKEYSYTVVHAKKGKVVVTAPTSYDAAQKAAKQWKLKSTGGVDAHLMKESNTVTHAHHGYGEILQRTDEGIDVMFEHGVEMGMSEATLTFLETVAATTLAKKATQVAGGGEKTGQNASKGEKEFADKHDKDDPKLAADDADGHEDATKAGRAVKSQSGTRGNEPRIGDKTIVNPVKGAVTKTTGKE